METLQYGCPTEAVVIGASGTRSKRERERAEWVDEMYADSRTFPAETRVVSSYTSYIPRTHAKRRHCHAGLAGQKEDMVFP
jgi:hypothetical protein